MHVPMDLMLQYYFEGPDPLKANSGTFTFLAQERDRCRLQDLSGTQECQN